ncbi:hypothetical protein [Roseococcus sp. YIM B11640]|uniref:hypothetical protein n=1 Tax=Roseococcus sp. YIM B11640 TaxID=3133973 RepID=UPI003C7D9B6C
MDHEKAVAEAGQKLHDAIMAARAAGYRVYFAAETLQSIAISATGKVERPSELEAPPVPTLSRPAPRPASAALPAPGDKPAA